MKKTQETAKYKRTNEILEDHGDWLLVDISTPTYPDATMAVDTDVFYAHEGGRIYARKSNSYSKTIYGLYHMKPYTGISRFLHLDVIDIDDGFDTDHIVHGNMSFVDNRRSNLRMATKSQNCMNKSIRVDNSSGVAGVYFSKSKKMWHAQISAKGKKHFLGAYESIDKAIDARKRAEDKYHGCYSYKGGAE